MSGMHDNDADSFGALARRARQFSGRTLTDVGRAIGRDHARMWRIEHGHVRPTTVEVDGLVRELALDAAQALALAAAVVPARNESTGESP